MVESDVLDVFVDRLLLFPILQASCDQLMMVDHCARVMDTLEQQKRSLQKRRRRCLAGYSEPALSETSGTEETTVNVTSVTEETAMDFP
ncbi:hypothetical protein V5799_024973 [Amblyomma americanum]|uniref:Uncharacterized protein n=1 Tax=Amblyomma americanum TaxID=6943 RepID=A0AAQ4EB16_AMBAM